jgi:hypothetical protein
MCYSCTSLLQLDSIESLQQREASLRESVSRLQSRSLDGVMGDVSAKEAMPFTPSAGTMRESTTPSAMKSYGAAHMPSPRAVVHEHVEALSSPPIRALRADKFRASPQVDEEASRKKVASISSLLRGDSVRAMLDHVVEVEETIRSPRQRVLNSNNGSPADGAIALLSQLATSAHSDKKSPRSAPKGLSAASDVGDIISRRVKVSLREQNLDQRELSLTKRESQLNAKVSAFLEGRNTETERLATMSAAAAQEITQLRTSALAEIETERAAVHRAMNELELLRTALSEKQENLQEREPRIAAAEQSIASQRSIIDKETAELLANRRKFDREYEDRLAYLERREQEAASHEVKLVHDRDAMQQQYKKLQEETSLWLHATQEQLANEKAALLRERATWEVEVERMKSTLQREREDLHQEQASILARVDQAAEIQAEAAEALAAAQGEARRIAAERQVLDEQAGEAAKRLDEVAQLEDELRARSIALEAKSVQIDETEAAHTREWLQMDKVLTATRASLNEESAALRKARIAFEQQSREIITAAHTSAAAVLHEAEETRQNLNARLAAVQQDQETIKTRLHDAELQRAALDNRAAVIERQCSEMKQLQLDLESKSRDVERAAARLERDRALQETRARETAAAMESRQSELDAQALKLQTMLADLTAQRDHALAEVEEKARRLIVVARSCVAGVTPLCLQAHAFQSNFKGADQQIALLKAQADASTTKLAAAEENIEDRKKQLQDLREKMTHLQSAVAFGPKNE